MGKYKIQLFDPAQELYLYVVEAKDDVEAVTIAMDTAFEEMPDNSFALASLDAL